MTFVVVVLLDATLSGGGAWSVIPAYAALVVEAVSSGIIDHTNGLLVPTLGNAFVVLISAVGAWPLSLLASFLSSVRHPFTQLFVFAQQIIGFFRNRGSLVSLHCHPLGPRLFVLDTLGLAIAPQAIQTECKRSLPVPRWRPCNELVITCVLWRRSFGSRCRLPLLGPNGYVLTNYPSSLFLMLGDGSTINTKL